MKLNKQNLVNKLGYSKEKAEWYLKMAKLIPVEDDGTVDGRKLHEVLKIGKAFSTWIKTQLNYIDAVENKDFITCLPLKETDSHGGQNKVDYKLTTQTAKHICMTVGVTPHTNENTKAISKDVRDYFIMSEEIAHKVLSWELEREDNVKAHSSLVSTFKREYMAKHGNREPKGWMYGQLQNDVYWIVFGVDANSIKEVLEIKHYESVPNNVQEQIDKALTWTYNRMETLIEMGMIDEREERANKVAEMFDKKFGGIIEF